MGEESSPDPPETTTTTIPQTLVLQKPQRWTSEHLRLLKVVHLRDVPAVDIVGAACFPIEGDKELGRVLSEIMKPSREDIWGRELNMRRNKFRHFFSFMSQLMDVSSFPPDRINNMTRIAADCMFFELIDMVKAGANLSALVANYTFKYRYGKFRCDGAILWESRSPVQNPPLIPLMTISVANDEEHTSIANHEVPQMLAQAVMMFDKYPNLKSYKTFVLRLRRTAWKLSTATITRFYMAALQKQAAVPSSLYVYSSKEFDMVEPNERKEMITLIVGLLRCVVDREEAG